MKNLYRVNIQHSAPKDTERGIICLLLANDDDQVFEFIKNQGNDSTGYICHGAIDGIDKYENIEEYKAEVMKTKGSMYHDDACYDDAYYGVTHTGWELLVEDCKTDYKELIAYNVLHDISK